MITNFFKKSFPLLFFIGSILVLGFFFIQWKSKSNQTEDFNEFSPRYGRFLEIGSENVFIQERGKKQKFGFVFIHGTGSWSELWRPLSEQLERKGFYTVAIDMAPFGFSYLDTPSDQLYQRKDQANKIVQIIKKLGLSKVHLVGHSFGGRATLTAALLIKEKIKGITLVNVALGFGNDLKSVSSKIHPNIAAVVKNDFFRNTIISIGTLPFLTKKLVSTFVYKESSITHSIEAMYKKPLRLKGKNEQLSEWLKEFLLTDDNELLEHKIDFKKLNIPVGVIWGDKDTVTPLWQGFEIKKMFSHASMVILKNVGHIPMIEDSTEFEKAFFDLLVL